MLVHGVIPYDKRVIEKIINMQLKTYNLISFYDNSAINNYGNIKKISKSLLIDSGAFSMINSNSNIEFDEYFKKYYSFVKKRTNDDIINGFFELDIGALIPYKQVLSYRSSLEEVSDKIIPVWHSYLGVKEFKKMCYEYDYISIGGIVSKEINKNKLAPFVKYAHKHNVKIHGLGVTDVNILKKVPFNSVDSSSWITVRFGRKFKFKNGKCDSGRINSNYVSENYVDLSIRNYINLIKFQDYFYNRWRRYHND